MYLYMYMDWGVQLSQKSCTRFSKSFDFIEIKIINISSDFSDLNNDFRLQKSIDLTGFQLKRFFGHLLIRKVIY